MKISLGLCGLPNSGKSTFLKLVSQVEALIAPYPFTTLKPQEAVAPVISKELEILHSITQTKEIIYPYLTFIDIPGLIRGAHQGEGLGNEFLSYLRGCEAILEIVRNFKREDVPHPEGDIDPERDLLIIEEEIMASEKEILERAMKKLEKTKGQNSLEKEKLSLLLEIYQNLKPFRRFFEYEEKLKEFNLLLTKSWFLLINGQEIKLQQNEAFKNIYHLDLDFELEIFKNPELQQEFPSKVNQFLNQLRKDLNLIQFFTFTKEITQGWFIKKGSKIIEVAEMIHSDFALKFKIAETISLEKFVEIKDWEKAKNLGLIKFKGKQDLIEENEIILIKI